jgi:hypothetical protein
MLSRPGQQAAHRAMERMMLLGPTKRAASIGAARTDSAPEALPRD